MSWRERRVQDLARLINGFPFSSDDFSSDAGYPLVRIRDILSGSFETFVPREIVPKDAVMADGDVVIGMDGDFNCTLWSRGSAALNQRLCLLRATADVDPRFLAYALPDHLSVINDLTYSTTVKHLSSSQVRSIRLPVPDFGHQRAIADLLDRETAEIDKLVAKQQALIAVLRERRASTIANSVTRGLDHAAPRVDTGIEWLGRVPAHWTIATLRRVGRLATGTTPSGDHDDVFAAGGGLGWARPEDLARIVVPSRCLTEKGAAQMRVVHDAVLVCGVGATVGRVGFAEGPISTNQQITAVCTDHDAVFWYYALTGARQELVRLSVGNTLPILNNERLNSLFVAIPPLREQREIAAHLDNETAKIDTLIGKAERFIELARERRSALITAAVTGEIDVRRGGSRRNVDARRQMSSLTS